MTFRLVCDDQDYWLPLSFETHVEERLVTLLVTSEAAPPQAAALSAHLSDVISAAIESGIAPPSEKQINYAVAIARRLRIEIPAIALQDRAAMHDFIAANVPAFQAALGREPATNLAAALQRRTR